MNKSIKNTITILTIILVGSYILDKVAYYSLNKLSDKVMSGQAIGKLNQYLLQKDSLKLVAFGSSRANHHIDVTQLSSSSFNMGTDGTIIAYSSTLIKLLPKDKEQIVVWHIDPNNVFNADYKGKDILGLQTKYHRNETIKSEIINIKQNNPLQTFYWSIDYNGKTIGILKNFFKPNYDYNSYNGYDPINVSEGQKKIFKAKLNTKKIITCLDDYKMYPIVSDYLKEVKRYCDENNKTLIIITSPIYKRKCDEQYGKMKSVMTNLGITYLDYSSFFATNNSIDYWKDSTHLSKKGAELFTRALKDSLIQHKVLKSFDN